MASRTSTDPVPEGFEPMKATLARRPFSDPAWVFEPKLDGIRAVARRTDDAVTLVSRTGRDITGGYPELTGALARQQCDDFVLDGEIVAFDGVVTSFARLQGRMGITDPEQALRTGIAVHFHVFDVVRLLGRDTTGLELTQRKQLLSQALEWAAPLHFVSHSVADGEGLFAAACEQGHEGLIAKRAASTYIFGRSREWLKLKCLRSQELVIGGFTAPRGSRRDFGALLLGYQDEGELVYAGKVGTGFDHETLAALGAAMRGRERATSPFRPFVSVPKHARWVEPELVAQIAFGEWTRDGRLRHPRFVGLREDKPAREVVRES